MKEARDTAGEHKETTGKQRDCADERAWGVVPSGADTTGVETSTLARAKGAEMGWRGGAHNVNTSTMERAVERGRDDANRNVTEETTIRGKNHTTHFWVGVTEKQVADPGVQAAREKTPTKENTDDTDETGPRPRHRRAYFEADPPQGSDTGAAVGRR